jgi:isopenicillin N synthase-like dioxygenase
MKETFEIGKESPENKFENRWPTGLAQFKETSMRFFKDMHDVNVQLMRAISLGLGMDECGLDSFVSKSDNNLRLLHYPVRSWRFILGGCKRIIRIYRRTTDWCAL